ncbi:N-6 DNA methylase [Chitinophaga solisilvae]|uniref:N-6 DNA methylase n=1 Tax=Chitinophaga solisilvae TaxID=1233460 RepID=UPI0023EEDCA7|nr:N-6 DNA methylase [Chitinophaga solisilvae]
MAVYDCMTDNLSLDKGQKQFLKFNTFFGNEIVASTRCLALMNLFLHNIGDIDSDQVMVSPNDSLISAPDTRYEGFAAVVLPDNVSF